LKRVGTQSQKTYDQYLRGAKKFLETVGMDAETLIAKVKKGEADVYELLDTFVAKMVEEGLSPTSIRVYLAGVKHFLASNGIYLNKEEFKDKVILPKSQGNFPDRIPTKEELKMMYYAARFDTRTMIVLMVSTGMRLGEVVRVKVEDINFDHDPPYIRLKPEYCKGKKGRIVLLTPEAVDHLKRLIFMKQLKPKDRLFPNYEADAWAKIMRVIERVGLLKKVNERRYELHPHSFRKYFRTMLAAAGVQESFIRMLLGHRSYLDESYLRANIEMVKEQWNLAIPYLTIMSTESRTSKVSKVLELAKALGVTADELIEALKGRFYFEGELTIDGLDLIYAMFPDIVISTLRYLAKKKLPANGGGRYVIVKGEQKLLEYLEAGYELVKELKRGKYLLKINIKEIW